MSRPTLAQDQQIAQTSGIERDLPGRRQDLRGRVRRTQGLARALFSTIALLAVVGCAAPKSIESRRKEHVLVLPGIGSADWLMTRLADILEREAGVSAQVWDWTAIEPSWSWMNLDNLTNREKNERRVRELVRQITVWRKQHPDTRLSLLGFSGGAGIAVFTCEELPPSVTIERLVVISGGISCNYDASVALRRVRRGVFNYYSRSDGRVLNAFIRQHGTMDRRFEAGAGYCGLNPPNNSTLGSKLFQLEWTPRFRELGNDGGHIGALAAGFVRRYITPLFRDEGGFPSDWRPTPPGRAVATQP